MAYMPKNANQPTNHQTNQPILNNKEFTLIENKFFFKDIFAFF